MRQLIAFLALVAALAFPATAPAQSNDRGVLQAFLEDNLSDVGRDVRIIGFEGALSGRATVEELSIADEDGVWITVKGAVFDWNRSALLRGALEINELSATEILLPRTPKPADSLPDPEAAPFALPELPVSIDIGALKVTKLSVGAPLLGQAADFALDGSASIAGAEGSAALSLIRIGGPVGRLRFEAAYSNESRILALLLDLTEDADGLVADLISLPDRPSIALRVAGTGPVGNYTADIALDTDGARRVEGSVTLGDAPDPTDPAQSMQVFSAAVGGDLRLLVDPQYRTFLGSDLRFAVAGNRFADGALSIGSLTLDAEAMSVAGAADIGADGWPRLLDLTARIAPPDGNEVLLSLPGDETWISGAEMALGYDADRGDAWTLDGNVTGLRQRDLALQSARITGRGSLSSGAEAVDGTVGLTLDGIAPTQPALAQAVGRTLSGGISFAWTKDAPLELTGIDVTGEDYALRGDATIAGVDGEIELAISGDVELEARDLSRFAALSGQQLDGGAAVNIAGSVSPVSGGFDLVVRGTGRDLAFGVPQVDPLLTGATALAITAARDAAGLRVERLSIKAATSEITASGTVTSEVSDIDFDIRLDDVARILPSANGPATLRGSATQRGALWTVKTQATGPGAASAGFDGTVTVNDGSPGPFSGTFSLAAGSLAPYADLVGRPLAGAVSLAAKAQGDLRALTGSAKIDGTTQDLSIGMAEVDNLLRGRSTLAVVAQQKTGGVSVFDVFELRSPQGYASVSGTVAIPEPGVLKDSDLAFDLRLDDVALVLPDASGPVTLKGTAIQRGEDWTVKTQATGLGDAEVGLDGRVTLRDGAPGPFAGTVNLSVGSLTPYAGLAKRPVTGAVSLTAAAQGDLSDLTGSATLDATAQTLGIGIPEVDQLLRGPSTLTIAARREAGGLAVFDIFVLRTPQGIADLTGSVSQDRSRVRYNLDLFNLGLFVPGLNGPVAAEGLVSSTGGPWAITSALRGPGGTTAAVDGQVARDGGTANLSISGAAPLALANRFIRPNLAEGLARFDLRVNGPPGIGALSGTVRATDARVTLPALRVSLNDIGAEIDLGGSAAGISARAAVSSGGQLRVEGRTGLTAPFSADLAGTLSSIVVTQPGLYETTLDGQLFANGPLRGGATLRGDLALGPTELRIPDSAGGGGGVLEGLVHLNEPAPVRQTRLRAGLVGDGGNGGPGPDYPIDLTIRAPSRIFIRGRGLDAELGGGLRLTGSTNDVVTQGRFDLIRGRLDILGKRLTLSEASARLQGDFDPFIRAVATTESGDAQISVIVEGLASAPGVSFTSTPDLPEDEILARLLFGRDLTQISALQALQMANAVRTLAGGGGEGVVGRLRQNFGLDDLDLTTGENGEAGLRVGKYISDNIYSDVTVDSSGKSEINLNLTITPSLTGRGTVSSDGNSGIGLFFERDY